MPDNEKTALPTQAVQETQRQGIWWFMRLAGAAAVFTIGLYVLIYFQTGAWQMLVVAGGVTLALACVPLAYGLLRRNRLNAAGSSLLIGVTLAYAGCELGWADATPYILGGGLLLIFLVGGIVLPRCPRAWAATALVFGGYIGLVNWLSPLPRYVTAQSAFLRLYIPGITAFLALGVLWQLARAYQQISTIRARLLASFVAIALLPLSAVAAGGSVAAYISGQQRAVSQLESVATLKEAEIQTWANSLQENLATAMVGRNTKSDVAILLQQQSTNLILRENVRGLLRDVIKGTGYFEELALLNLAGQVVLSTDPAQEGKIFQAELYFKQGLQTHYIEPPFYSIAHGKMSVIAAQPVTDLSGQAIGVLAGRANLDRLNAIMLERAGLGDTGETYLVGANRVLLTASRFESFVLGQTFIRTEGASQAIDRHSGGYGLYSDYRGVPVIGVYRWLPELQVALLAEQDQSEALRAIYIMLAMNIGIMLLAAPLAIFAALAVTRSIANPLGRLAETAGRIAAGELDQAAPVERADEVGALAQAFNSMTAQLRDLIASLEQRVTDRTRDLEQRSTYLEASAQVGRAAASILETDELLRSVVDLILDRFNLYYVGLFLVDETGEWAVLRAGTGSAGQQMLARGHHIKIGEGMIGWSVAHAEARVALRAGEDAVRLATAELPDTRSEAALPLRSRGQVIGALTVQSDRPGVFDQDTITVLQIMADQVAVALDNARLFAQSQAALQAQRRAYGELSRQAWLELLRARPDLRYRSDARGVSDAAHIWRPEMEQAIQAGQIVQFDQDARRPLAIPIKSGDTVIGVVDACKADNAGEWTPAEITLLKEITQQLSVAMESARLYQDTQRRAAQEQLLSEATARMRESLDLNRVLQTAAREFGEKLGATVNVKLTAGAPPAPAQSQPTPNEDKNVQVAHMAF